MKAAEFQRWLAKLATLTAHQRESVEQQLRCGDPRRATERLIAQLSGPVERCPHCGHAEVGRWGSSGGLERYRCKGCGKTFNALTGTPLARLRHREQWQTFMLALIEGQSVRQAAERCGVDKNTAFLWRHRFLRLPAEQKAKRESGIVEADETYFLESFKGSRRLPRAPRKRGGKAAKRGLSAEQIPVLIARDRVGETADFVLPKADKKHVGAVLKPLLAEDAILCTDGGGSGVYAAVAREHKLTHRFVNVRAGIKVVGKVYHVQNVNAYTSRLKGWMRRFHGVATKYLPNYLGWRRMLERSGSAISPPLCIALSLGRARPQQFIQT
ncbi:IS1595 family transposase [Ralstonia sp. SET104]|uniref:IS1595 family transposase n=1 Tax=Ralstonia sp. SET104 TaxID=2448774 RepID=UPI000F5699E5|nr:IS1595 family transposase [Ralstonia sp. SET104]GCB06833.1 transposase [Ralstonia sp. SET104]